MLLSKPSFLFRSISCVTFPQFSQKRAAGRAQCRHSFGDMHNNVPYLQFFISPHSNCRCSDRDPVNGKQMQKESSSDGHNVLGIQESWRTTLTANEGSQFKCTKTQASFFPVSFFDPTVYCNGSGTQGKISFCLTFLQ